MKTILIIDDNEADRGNYAEFLGRNGYRVLQAGDGNTGLSCSRNDAPIWSSPIS